MVKISRAARPAKAPALIPPTLRRLGLAAERIVTKGDVGAMREMHIAACAHAAYLARQRRKK